jgi:type II secretory pathway component PulC
MNKINLILLFFAFLMCIFLGFIFRDIIKEIKNNKHILFTEYDDSVFLNSQRLINQALNFSPQIFNEDSQKNLVNPFMKKSKINKQKNIKTSKSEKKVVIPNLILRGILYKEKPLAILEDKNGKTWILGIEDTIMGLKISKINKTSVLLKNKSSSFEITVKD